MPGAASWASATPEAAIGGPLALIRDGDLITLDVDAGTIDVAVDDATLEARRTEWAAPAKPAAAPAPESPGLVKDEDYNDDSEEDLPLALV